MVANSTTAAAVETMAVAAAEKVAVDDMWILVCGFLVIFMQAGFSMLEAGAVSANNVKSILLKNMADLCIGTLGWVATGYALFNGKDNGTGFYGTTKFFMEGVPPSEMAFFLFQLAFACTAATIVSGAVAERIRLNAYFINSFVVLLIIYPFPCHWVWNSDGWLYKGGFLDFAGSMVVHMVGGICGLIVAIRTGPRIGRFDFDLGLVNNKPAHSAVLTALGVWILFFGWFGFNSGSSLAMTGGSNETAASAAANTMVAAVMAVIASLCINEFVVGQQSLNMILNSLLGGLVGITAPCGFVSIGSAAVIGTVAGIVYTMTSHIILHKFHVDDPVDAFAVHAGCGIWGTLAVGLFHTDTGLLTTGGTEQIKWQLYGLLATIPFVAVIQTVAILILDAMFRSREQPDFGRAQEYGESFAKLGIRVAPDVEIAGCDSELQGEAAYAFLDEKLTLEDCLDDKEVKALFRAVLRKLQCEEMMDFYEDVLRYEEEYATNTSTAKTQALAARIFDKYFTIGGRQELNIRGGLKESVRNALGSLDPDLFTTVKTEVIQQMRDNFSSHFADSAELERLQLIRKEDKMHKQQPVCHCLARICCGVARQSKDALTTLTVEEQLADAQCSDATSNKLLILGAGESGKTTTVNQLVRVFSGGTVSANIRMKAMSQLRMNVFQAIKILIKRALSATSTAAADEVEKWTDEMHRILAFDPAKDGYKVEDATAVAALWNSAPIQAAWGDRDNFWCLNNTKYFLDNAVRFAGDDDITDDDLSMFRKMTTGVSTLNFFESGTKYPQVFDGLQVKGAENVPYADVLNFMWQVVDVGGQRSERRKWLSYMDNVNCCVFLVNLNGYRERLFEDEAKLKIQECMELFEQTFGARGSTLSGLKIPFYVVFNKYDFFKENFNQDLFMKAFEGHGCTREQCVDADTAVTFVKSVFMGVVDKLGLTKTRWNLDNVVNAIEYADIKKLHGQITAAVIKNAKSRVQGKLKPLGQAIKKRFIKYNAALKKQQKRTKKQVRGKKYASASETKTSSVVPTGPTSSAKVHPGNDIEKQALLN